MTGPARARIRLRTAAPALLAWLVVGLVVGLVGPALAQTPVQAADPPLPQSVTLAGSMGADKALLVVDGQTLMLAVGASARGVTLRALTNGVAEVVVAGQPLTLRLGGMPARLGRVAAPADSGTIVLPMGSGGHFGGPGTINGRAVQFLVDTGATSVALSQAEANRIGLDWKRGTPGMTNTANGSVPIHAINLTSVRLGSVELANVAAIVLPAEMPMVLLGNSFLSRFAMRQDNDVMRLEKKP
jgi:aspartyl protease family protein